MSGVPRGGLQGYGLFALLPTLLVFDGVRLRLESSMALHMLVEFPLLALAGAVCAQGSAREKPVIANRWREVDGEGLWAIAMALMVTALWMVPAALDAALIRPEIALAKYISWWTTGALLALGLPAMRMAMRCLLAGNLSWMTATAGLLYLETPRRLCVNYRFDEQMATGAGLCAAAVATGAWLLWPVLRRTGSSVVPGPNERPSRELGSRGVRAK